MVDENFIKGTYIILTKNSAGPKAKLECLTDMEDFFRKEYVWILHQNLKKSDIIMNNSDTINNKMNLNKNSRGVKG